MEEPACGEIHKWLFDMGCLAVVRFNGWLPGRISQIQGTLTRKADMPILSEARRKIMFRREGAET